MRFYTFPVGRPFNDRCRFISLGGKVKFFRALPRFKNYTGRIGHWIEVGASQTCYWITLKWFNHHRVFAVFESFGCWACSFSLHRFAWYSNVFEYSQTLIALYVVCDHIVTANFISSLKYSTTPPHTASWYALVQPPTSLIYVCGCRRANFCLIQ